MNCRIEECNRPRKARGLCHTHYVYQIRHGLIDTTPAVVLDLPDEQWTAIGGYEGLYEISDHGRVRSVDRITSNGLRWKGRVLSFGVTGRMGHLKVGLTRGGEKLNFSVHRLVLETFVGPCPDGMEACHFPDRDPANNHVSNLRWDTHEENMLDRARHDSVSRGVQCWKSKLNDTDIERIFDLRRAGHLLREIADWIGTSASNIGYILRRKTWAHVPLPGTDH